MYVYVFPKLNLDQNNKFVYMWIYYTPEGNLYLVLYFFYFHLFLICSVHSPPSEGYAPGIYEKARTRFAHAETLLPFSCLIGLFLEESGECLYSRIRVVIDPILIF